MGGGGGAFEQLAPAFKQFGYALALSTAFEILYYLSTKLYKKKSEHAECDNDVIFFPDETIACDAHFSYGCTNRDCKLSHTETSSMKLLKFINSAQKTMDVCIYCIASHELVDAVLKVQQRGVYVRVVTDGEQAASQESQIGKLRANGVEVRMNSTTFYMHHKFVVVDNQRMLTGSFNWSRNAMLGNDENIILTSNAKVLRKYAYVFSNLWVKYNSEQTAQPEA